jgi:competence protein ComEA
MPKKSQFKNLALQQTLQDCAQQPTTIQPAITLPIKPEALIPLPPAMPFFVQSLPVRQGPTAIIPKDSDLAASASDTPEEISTPFLPGALIPSTNPPLHSRKKKQLLRGAAILLSALLILAIYLTWHSATPTAASPTITQQAYSSLSSTPSPQPVSSVTTATSSDGTTIQVYIVGAVKHPGVYTLPADARVYQLIQAAGGTQPNADLVSINLAARLTDGQEIYVLSVGETQPAYTGSSAGTGAGSAGSTPTTANGPLVNINTATETAMMQGLHVSAATAKKIIDYRTQHGAYTSVDQLLQVVSKSIYDRIKGLVTV